MPLPTTPVPSESRTRRSSWGQSLRRRLSRSRRCCYRTPGRAYYLRRQAEGKSRKEALRALKRRISDAVYRRLVADAQH
jgi:hypothetical protein